MSATRYTPAGPRDMPQSIDGDATFRGVRDKGEPDQIEPGLLHSLVNGLCTDGTARTRPGSQTPAGLQLPTLEPLLGSGVFSDPLQTEWLLLATATAVWRLRDGFTPQRIALPAPLTSRVTFAQAFRTVLLFRGPDLPPWEWDGTPLAGFQPIDQLPAGDTAPIPNGPDRIGLEPVLIQNRLIIPHGRSELAVSDLLDYTRYDATFASFNVTGGKDDRLTGLLRYNQAALLIFNDQSVQLLNGIEPTLANLSLEPVNDEVGCIAGKTIARLGGDVVWLADAGVFTLTEVGALANRQTQPVALSDPIRSTIERINWRAAGRSVAAVWGDSYYLAVPIDGADRPNVVLPYNTALQAWQGVHTFPPAVRFDSLHLLDWFGRKRLHGVDYATGRVHLLYEGFRDIVGNAVSDISLELTTRGYPLQQTGRKRFARARLCLQSWLPRTTVSLVTDGVAERTVLTSALTRDRRRSTVWGRPNYDPSNAGDDHGQPFREDYSVDVATPFDPGSQGIDFDLHQHHQLPVTMRARGRYAALHVRNDRGTLAVASITLEGTPVDPEDRPTP